MQLLDTSQERAVLDRYFHTWEETVYEGMSVESDGSISWNTAPTEFSDILRSGITEGEEADKNICGTV